MTRERDSRKAHFVQSFNYLLPGVVFAVLAGKLSRFSFTQQDLVIAAFLYYLTGLVISRVGSLVLDPLLKSISFIKRADYKDFVAASKVDSQIDILSEANNTYRTLCATFMLLLLLKVYDKLSSMFPAMTRYEGTGSLVLLMLMFLFAYRKQTSYVSKRVRSAMTNSGEEKAKAANA